MYTNPVNIHKIHLLFIGKTKRWPKLPRRMRCARSKGEWQREKRDEKICMERVRNLFHSWAMHKMRDKYFTYVWQKKPAIWMEFGGIVIVVNYLNWRAIQCTVIMMKGSHVVECASVCTQKYAGCTHAHIHFKLVIFNWLPDHLHSWFTALSSSSHRLSTGQISIFMKFNMIKMNIVRGRFAFFPLLSLFYFCF